MKRLKRFIRDFKLFVLALVAFFAALILQFSGYPHAVAWLLGTVCLFEVCPLLWNMWKDFRAGSYGIDILAATAIIAAVLLQQYWAAIVIVLMLTGGESLEQFAEHRANSELSSLLKHAPVRAHVIRKGKMIDVSVRDIHVGEKILVKQGEVVPVDAQIIDGIASFDEASITGESMPKFRQVGDQLLSGSISLDGVVTAKALASAEDSQYQQIIKLVRGAAASKAPFVRLSARYSLPFTFAAFAIASTVWILSGQAIRFLEVIVVATPCPLLLAVPIALISGMSRASRYGIIMKTGGALEQFADAQTIAFDKTGTLTQGVPRLDSVIAYNSFSESEVLRLAGSIEANSNHVLAQAIVDGAKSAKLKLIKMKQVKEIAGQGIQAVNKGQQLLVGRFSLLESNGVHLPSEFKKQRVNQTAVYVAANGSIAGIITLDDELRPESVATLKRLQNQGLRHTLMITGDNEKSAQAIARKLGIGTVHANMLPSEKLQILDEVKRRPLAFVGDGVNDAPALTASDVGIALGARGNTAASESADIVIMNDDLRYVAQAHAISKRTIHIALQSIFVGIGLSIVLMLIYATGKFSPVSGAIAQEVVDVLVIFNALRAHFGTLQPILVDAKS